MFPDLPSGRFGLEEGELAVSELSKLNYGEPAIGLVRAVTPFIGRRQYLDLIGHWLEEARAGRPQVVLIRGDAGAGKTRLLKEVQPLAGCHGLEVCYGRCYEDVVLPYLPFVESLLVRLADMPEEVAQTLGADAEVIRLFLERVGTAPSTAGLVQSAETDQDTLRLYLALTRATIALAQHRPTVLILDDLHWADRSSLDLFSHLVFAVADAAVRESVPLLIIVAHRPVEPEDRLARAVARFQREDICQTLELPGLAEGEVNELLQSLGVVRPSHQLVATVSGATQGNPLFIQEVLHHLVERGALEERGGYVVTTASSADLRLPAQVTVAITARLQGLSEDCRRVLTLASFLGDHFSFQALRALSELSEDTLLDMLEEGVRQHLLLSEEQTFQFAHPLILHVFYNEPIAVRRQRIHLQIAQTLERLYAGTLDAHLLEIARHLVSAGPAAEAEKVMEYVRRAGDLAFTLFAWGEAARYYEAALTVASSIERFSAHERAEFHHRAGLAYYRDMDIGPGLDHYEKAIEAYRLTDDMEGLAHVLMAKTRAYMTQAAVPYGTLIDMHMLEEVLSTLGVQNPGLRGRILATMAEAHWLARLTDKAEELARQALEIGQNSQDDLICFHANHVLALVCMQRLHPKEALESWRNALALARKAENLWLQSWPLTRIPWVLTGLGQLDEAQTVALEACALTRRIHNWAEYSMAVATLVVVAVIRGDFEAAERHSREVVLMVRRSHYPWGGLRSLTVLACARSLRGIWAEAEDALDMAVEPGRLFARVGLPLQAIVRRYHQLIQVYQGAADEVKQQFASNPPKARERGRVDINSLSGLCALAEIAERIATPAIAEPLRPLLSLAAERGVIVSTDWVFLIPRVLGVVASLNQQWDEAETYFQTAIDTAERMGARPELGRTCLDYARMLAVRNQASDRAQALGLIQQAAAIFGELGMEPFVQQVAQLAGELKADVPQAPQLSAPPLENLSEREISIVDRIVQGRTKPEIADELILGAQTLDHYVRNVTGKIRVICFTDMKGSTENIARWGDAKAYELLRTHDTIIRACLTAHNGSEIKRTGDGFLITFFAASDAVTCAQAVQRAFVKYNQEHPDTPISVRIGLNAGEPTPDEGDLFGAAVSATARICAHAQPGQVFVSEVVRQLVAGKDFTFTDCGAVELKGFVDPFHLFAVQWEESA